MSVKKLTTDELFEIIRDEKTYKILNAIGGGEKSTEEILKETQISFKPFRYISARLFTLNLITERVTFKTRYFAINEDGVIAFAKKIENISDELFQAAAILNKIS